jgi:hypothetical protein
MNTKKLLILATEYSRTKDADEIFEKRGWIKVTDRTKTLPISRVVRRSRKETSLFDLIIEEIEYRRR